MKLSVITEYDQLLQIESDWRRLFNESHCNNSFVSFDWVSKWWQFFGADLQMQVIAFIEANRIVGIGPFAVFPDGTKRIFRFMGWPRVTYMDLLIEEPYREACMEQLLAHLQNSTQWQLVDLQGLGEDSPNYALLCNLLQHKKTPFFNTKTVSYYIDLADKDFDAHLKDRSRIHNSISNIKRNTNKIKLLGDLTYRVLEGEEFEKIFSLHDKRWMKKNDCSGFSSSGNRQFFTQLARTKLDDFKVHVTALWLDQRLLACEYGLRCNGCHELYRVVHDDDFSVYGPGKMIIKEIIHSCFQEGLQIYNFGSGFERYKGEWTDQKTFINRIVFPAQGPNARLLFKKRRFIDTTLHPLKQNPALVRFKRDTLGKLRYWVLTYFLKKLLPKYGLLGVAGQMFRRLKTWICDRQEYILSKHDIQIQSCGYSDYILREATMDDVSAMVQRMELETSEIIRRFYKNDKYLILSKNNQFCCGGWLSFARLAIPKWDYVLPLAKGDVVLYEYYSESEQTGERNSEFKLFVDYLLNYLKKQNQRQLYLGGAPSQKVVLRVPDLTGYRIDAHILRLSWFGRIKYKITPPLTEKENK